MIVDAHQHFWTLSRADYHWLTPELKILYRDYLPEDLAPLLRRTGVSATILVQAAATEAETAFLLDVAAATEYVAGVVGWLDFEDEAFVAKLDALRHQPKFVGVRPMIQDVADDRWMLRPIVLDHLAYVAAEDVPFDFLTLPRHLPHVVSVLERLPTLRAVIDHLSKPPIASRALDPWREDLSRVAAFPNVCCKLSGMVTEADPQAWRIEDLAPYVEHVLSAFGTNRVLFGSDWPVCLMSASYAEVINALRTVVGPLLDTTGINALFGGNARRFYRLSR